MKPDLINGNFENNFLRPCNLYECTKRQIQDDFENAYSLTEWLFSSLKDEKAFYVRPDKLRMPLIFYYAHTAVFYVNKLLLAGLIKNRISVRFESIFETGVNENAWDDTERPRMGTVFKWPPVEEVHQYRSKVRKLVLEVILQTALEHPINVQSKWWALFMGIEHDRIHFETSSVLLRQLPVSMVQKPDGWKYGPLQAKSGDVEDVMLKMRSETVTIGKQYSSSLWGWDVEYGERNMRVPSFEASKHLVTNKEYLEFVASGGYEKRKLWDDEGWKWQTSRQARHPAFWVCHRQCKSSSGPSLAMHNSCGASDFKEGEYGLRLMFDIVSLPLDWPVEVNFLEAKAYCSWKGGGYRLPTEAEHHIMRSMPPFDLPPTIISDGKRPQCNIGMIYGSPTPVNMYPSSASGFCDTSGNVWEWVEDELNMLPGAETHYLYDDYTATSCDGNHNLILGGGWATTGSGATRYTRSWFRRHFYSAGFRVTRTIEKQRPSPFVRVHVPGTSSERKTVEDKLFSLGLNPMDTESGSLAIRMDTEETLVHLVETQYLGESYSLLHTIQQYITTCKDVDRHMRALVIGCGPGRVAFELTKTFHEVVGSDTSEKCVTFATKLNLVGEVLLRGKRITLPSGTIAERVVFKQFHWIPVEFGKFDFVVVDAFERVQNQTAWLAVLPNILINSDSLAVICQRRENVVFPVENSMESVCVPKAVEDESRDANTTRCQELENISMWRKAI